MFESGYLDTLSTETFETLSLIHKYLFDEIVEKYVEMNIAHLFREGNGRATRIWLDLIFEKELGKVVDWSLIDKEDYLLAIERNSVKDIEIKHILKNALTDEIGNREVYMKGIDHRYYYEGYTTFKTEELVRLRDTKAALNLVALTGEIPDSKRVARKG